MRDQRKRARCRKCERLREEVGRLSARGLCADCSDAGFRANVEAGGLQVSDYWQRWREGVAASVGLQVPGERDGR